MDTEEKQGRILTRFRALFSSVFAPDFAFVSAILSLIVLFVRVHRVLRGSWVCQVRPEPPQQLEVGLHARRLANALHDLLLQAQEFR